MAFPKEVRIEALISCQRHCCLCREQMHTLLVCHHIVQEADSGSDDFDNCIPLCPNCHSAVENFNPRHHPGTSSYSIDELLRRRDDWYAIIKRRSDEQTNFLRRSPSNYPHNKLLQGTASFNYSHFDGFYRLGEGNSEFLTHWSKADNTAIHCYKDGTNISIALPQRKIRLQEISNANSLNFTSRVRTPELGQYVVFENHQCRYAAAKIIQIQDDKRGHSEDNVVFNYWILEDGSDDFSNIIS